MRLGFYSGGDAKDNLDLDHSILEMVETKSPKLTYIPSCSYDSHEDFRYFVKQYKKFDVSKFIYFPIDIPFDEIMLKEVFDSDIIHLGGGNTYYFLKHMRKSGFAKKLYQYVEKGGILTGLSAGAIMMTPQIDTASFPDFDRDENQENIRNLRALNLVDFEFYPHYKNSKRYEQCLINYSKKSNRPLYACPDGSGIIVTDKSITFHGKTYCFFRGEKVNIQCA